MRDMLYSLTTDIEPMYLREIRRKEELNYRFTQPTSDDYVKLDKTTSRIMNIQDTINKFM